jgi:CBS domain-containing protein
LTLKGYREYFIVANNEKIDLIREKIQSAIQSINVPSDYEINAYSDMYRYITVELFGLDEVILRTLDLKAMSKFIEICEMENIENHFCGHFEMNSGYDASGFKLNVKEIMVEDVVGIQPDATVKKAVDLMNEHNIGCLIVTTKEETIGIITERDVLKRAVSESKALESTKVSEVMSKPLIVGRPDMHLQDAAKLMSKKKIKKLPIMKKEKLLGIITLTDISKAMQDKRENLWKRFRRVEEEIGKLKEQGIVNLIQDHPRA